MEISQREDFLARYMVGRYRLGYEQFALYLAGVLFESVISRKLMKYKNWSSREVENKTLKERIDSLNDKACNHCSLFREEWRSVFTKFYCNGRVCDFSSDNSERRKQVRNRLHHLRKVRNKVMHGQYDELARDRSNTKEDLIHYVWSELAPDSFEKTRVVWDQRGRFGNVMSILYEHTADYMVRAIDEVEIKKKDAEFPFHDDWVLSSLDFDNLFNLRKKLVPLKNRLEGWLKEHADFLHTDILTTIDTTSAYIWMPLTRIHGETQQGILTCSVSILVTPNDFRIYMDFGGNAAEERGNYYDFLKSDEYQATAKKLFGLKDFFVFDTEWYCFITRRTNIQEWNIGQEKVDQIDQAESKIRPVIAQYMAGKKDPITWNRLLHGFVIDRSVLESEPRFIDFSMIEERLAKVIEFFVAFESFKRKRLEHGS